MHADEDFLAAVAAEPYSTLTRLVYADWLDERSDPRAELIRHEEQMREWPVFSDEYWQAKPRRAELRARFDPAWVRALGYGVAVPPLFRHGWPDELRSRWRLIREAYELCTGHPMPDVGGHPELVAEAEANLQDKLPESVAHLVAFARDGRSDPEWPFAGITDFTAQQDLDFVWLFEADAGGDYLCVRRADWHLPDPLVVVAPPVDGDPETGLVFDTPDAPPSPLGTLSEYVLLAILTRYHGTGGEWGDRVPLDAVRARLTERFGPPVAVAFRNGVEEEVFESDDALLRLEELDDGAGFLRASVRPGRVAAIRDLLDFPPTADGYRGGAFLPTSPDIPEGYWSGRVTNESIASEAGFRAGDAYNQLSGRDLPATERWLRLSAEFGDPEAAFGLYQLHEEKVLRLPTSDYIAYFRQSLATDRPAQWYNFGLFRMQDQIAPPDYPEALTWLRKAFDAGRRDAARYIGLCYAHGLGGVQDSTEAARWFEADGSPESLHDLAALLYDGHGNLPANRSRAEQLLTRSGEATSQTRSSSKPHRPQKDAGDNRKKRQRPND